MWSLAFSPGSVGECSGHWFPISFLVMGVGNGNPLRVRGIDWNLVFHRGRFFPKGSKGDVIGGF